MIILAIKLIDISRLVSVLNFHGNDFLYIKAALKDECPVNTLRVQNLAGSHFLGHKIRFVFVSLSI